MTSERCFVPINAAIVLRTNLMNPLAPSLTQDPAGMAGDAHPLVAQLGTAGWLMSLHALAESLATRPINEHCGIAGILRAYHERILLPHELPAIRTALLTESEDAGIDRLLTSARRTSQHWRLCRRQPADRAGTTPETATVAHECVVQRYLAAVEGNQAQWLAHVGL